ncbi:hypothetical protein JCM2421_04620 [Staphylococcus auricularis]|nr:hypothetical protein JCM2421_04620 [Staphylococcus auricularis]
MGWSTIPNLYEILITIGVKIKLTNIEKITNNIVYIDAPSSSLNHALKNISLIISDTNPLSKHNSAISCKF